MRHTDRTGSKWANNKGKFNGGPGSCAYLQRNPCPWGYAYYTSTRARQYFTKRDTPLPTVAFVAARGTQARETKDGEFPDRRTAQV